MSISHVQQQTRMGEEVLRLEAPAVVPLPSGISTEPSFTTARPGRLRHDLHLHPLMQLPALLALAKELQPNGGCRFLDPSASDDSTFLHTDHSHAGLGIDEVLRRIELPGSWVALYNIENVPRYRELLEGVLSSVRAQVEREQPGIFLVTGFIFISAPPSITPFHIDRENNFWLQIRGRKVLTIWDRQDPSVVPTAAVEEFIVHRDLSGARLTETVRRKGREIDVGPGDGVYFPSTTPHMTRSGREWTRPGDGVAISIGVNFYTATTRQHALVHQFNRVLRRAGVKPLPPGLRPWRDQLKAPFGRLALAVLKRRRKDYVVPPGVS